MAGPTHVAFLRAVNVGGRTARKEQLIAAALTTGATDVTTFIASGNLLFAPGTLIAPGPTADADTPIAAALESALAHELGFSTEVFVRTRTELVALATGDPFDGAVDLESGTYNVGFLREPLGTETASALQELSSIEDRVTTIGREIHWHTIGKMSDSVLFQRPTIDKVVGVPVTMRNVRTVRRLADKLAA